MFLPRAPSPTRNTPPPVQSLQGNQPTSPILMLPSRHDSPPKDCLALTWRTEKEKVSPSKAITPVGAQISPGATSMYQQSRAVVFDSPSGHRTICLQNTLCYTLPPNAPKGSPFSPSLSFGSPDKTKHGPDGSPSPRKHGATQSLPAGSESPRDGRGKETRASPGTKTSQMRNLSGGSRSPQDQGDSRRSAGSPDTQVRQRHHPKGRKDLQLPRDGPSRLGRNLAGSDRYQGILEQDHPEETVSRGFLASCYCYVIPLFLLVLLFGVLLVWFFGAPSSLASMFASSSLCPSINITDVRHELEKGLIGQPVASHLILDALRGGKFQDGSKPLVMFFHGSSGVGKTHTANIITESVLKRPERDSCIHLFSSDVFMREERERSKEMFIDAIEDWLNGSKEGKPDTCCFSFFIFDDLRDDTPPDLTQALGQALSRINSKYPSQSKTGTEIFIIITRTGSKAILEFLVANMRRRHTRNSLATQQPNWQEPWRHLIANLNKQDSFQAWLPPEDYVRIPFLPLERYHIKQCAKRRLEHKNMTATEERLEWVADQLTYYPEDWPIFSSSGCKKVAGKVDLLHKDSPRTFEFKKPF
ncbi:torsin-2A-like [Patiria miniata]|uniref:Torsin-1A C-terminal domain-containing protein n=1 Tax=Patiria miniata TaxID=46514 RepID=A0A914AIW4_PATMI|nr:torsin-2A-like [Patiria miniata]